MAMSARSNLARCRIAACGGICGAVIVPAAMLALYYFLQVQDVVDHVSIVITIAVAAIGAALMLLAGRFAGEAEPRFGSPAIRLPLRADRGDEAILNQ
jgi:hypothetical protein